MVKQIMKERELLGGTAYDIRHRYPSLTTSDLVDIAENDYNVKVIISPLFIMSNGVVNYKDQEYIFIGALTEDLLQDQAAHELAHVIVGHNRRNYWRPEFIDDWLADLFSRQVNGYSKREQGRIRAVETMQYLKWIQHDGDWHSQEDIDKVRQQLPELWDFVKDKYVNAYIPS